MHRMLLNRVRPSLMRALPTTLVQQPRPLASAIVTVAASKHLSTAASAATATPTKKPELVAELERMEREAPWWRASLMRMCGMFSETQVQKAAGGDMYWNVLQHIADDKEHIMQFSNLPTRYYTQFQLRGLHAWLAHTRLRDEAKDSYAALFRETMEHIWYQMELDLSREFGFGFIEISKHLKASQFSWHGMCRNLDAALEEATPREAMAEVLLRNMYVDEEGDLLVDEAGNPLTESWHGALALADYLLAQKAHLSSLPGEDVLKGRLTFVAALPISGGAAQAV